MVRWFVWLVAVAVGAVVAVVVGAWVAHLFGARAVAAVGLLVVVGALAAGTRVTVDLRSERGR